MDTSWQNHHRTRSKRDRKERASIETAEHAARDVRLRAIATLSQSAVHLRDRADFLDEVVRVVTQTLGADGCAIVQFTPHTQDLHMRASVPKCNTGASTTSTLRERGLESGVQVTIGTEANPWGMFVLFPKRGSLLCGEDMDFLQSVASVVALAVAREDAQFNPTDDNELLKIIFDQCPVMISFRDPSGRLMYVNRAWERTLGWTLREAQDTQFFDVLYPDPVERREVFDFMDRCDERWSDFQMRTRSGEVIDAQWARFRLSDHSSLGFGVDITERKRAERALVESEQQFTKIFQISPVALGISTLGDGRIIDVNDKWLEIFGYRRSEVIGRTNDELRVSVQPTREKAVEQLHAAGDQLRDIEIQVRRASGEVRDVMASVVPVMLGSKQETWLSAVVDITDRKRTEAERDRLLESEKAARAEVETALERLRAIERITDTAVRNLDLDELLEELLTRVKAVLNVDFASVSLVDERRRELYPRSIVGRTVLAIQSVRAPIGYGVAGKVAADGQPRVENDLTNVDFSRVAGASQSAILEVTRSMIAAPLKVGGKIIGVVTAASSEPHQFRDDDLKLLLVVADRVAPAIERSQLIESIHKGRERLRALSARLLTAQEEERRRLAFELHDELGQVLTAVKINLQALEHKRVSAKTLRDVIASVDQAMERVRGLALDLRPSMLDDLGLPAALRWYTDRFARDTGIDMRFSADAAIRLDPESETACFRVAQEALTNVLRHARAKHVSVDLHVGAGGAELKITDDGEGFDVAAARERAAGGASLGLLGMEERVFSCDGELDVQSAPGQGTEIVARFRSATGTRKR